MSELVNDVLTNSLIHSFTATLRPMRRRLWILLLPLGLLLLSGGLLGTYFETNDDLGILGMVRGATTAAPQTDLYLYFHGYAALWTRLYAAWPLVPWYGGDNAPMGKLVGALRSEGVYAFGRYNVLLVTPPLTIAFDDLNIGFEALDKALKVLA